MKTEEEILIEIDPTLNTNYLNDVLTVKSALRAMELYAAELKKENQQLQFNVKTGDERIQSLLAELQELKKENERLRPLIAKIKKSIVEDAIHWDPAKANELLQDCEKALKQ